MKNNRRKGQDWWKGNSRQAHRHRQIEQKGLRLSLFFSVRGKVHRNRPVESFQMHVYTAQTRPGPRLTSATREWKFFVCFCFGRRRGRRWGGVYSSTSTIPYISINLYGCPLNVSTLGRGGLYRKITSFFFKLLFLLEKGIGFFYGKKNERGSCILKFPLHGARWNDRIESNFAEMKAQNNGKTQNNIFFIHFRPHVAKKKHSTR